MSLLDTPCANRAGAAAMKAAAETAMIVVFTFQSLPLTRRVTPVKNTGRVIIFQTK
jgi:hypothetical protein